MSESHTSSPVDKRALIAALRERLVTELERCTGRAVDAANAATHEENRAESDKDMRSTEASYVARGHAERARQLELALAQLSALVVRDFGPGNGIQVSAFVTLDQDGRQIRYLIVPAAGGERLRDASGEVLTLATTSPLGAALIGLTEGEEAEVTTPQGVRHYVVARVE